MGVVVEGEGVGEGGGRELGGTTLFTSVDIKMSASHDHITLNMYNISCQAFEGEGNVC